MTQIQLKTEQLKFDWNKLYNKEPEGLFSIRLVYKNLDYITAHNCDKLISYYFDYICERESTLERVLDKLVELLVSDSFFTVFFPHIMNRISEILDEYDMPQTKELHIHTFSYICEEFGIDLL